MWCQWSFFFLFSENDQITTWPWENVCYRKSWLLWLIIHLMFCLFSCFVEVWFVSKRSRFYTYYFALLSPLNKLIISAFLEKKEKVKNSSNLALITCISKFMCMNCYSKIFTDCILKSYQNGENPVFFALQVVISWPVLSKYKECVHI